MGALADVVLGEHAHYLAGPALFVHPLPNIRVLAAPALAYSDGHSEFVFRSGLGYDLHVGLVTLSPTVSLDVSAHHRAVVPGLAAGTSF